MTTIDDVRAFAMTLPRTTEALVRDRVKFRVGRIVFVAFSRDETEMGFGFPKEEREALVRSDPDKFMMPGKGDLRYHWVECRLAALDATEMRELVLDAWRMCVPQEGGRRVRRPASLRIASPTWMTAARGACTVPRWTSPSPLRSNDSPATEPRPRPRVEPRSPIPMWSRWS